MNIYQVGLYSLLLFLIGYYYIQHVYASFKRKKILHVPGKFPFGNMRENKQKQFVFSLNYIYNKFKEQDVLCGYYSMMSPVIMPLCLNLIKSILIKDFNKFHDRGLYLNEKYDPLSAHLFTLSGSRWRNMRAKLSPTFTSGRMKEMFPIVVKYGDELVKYIEDNKPSDSNGYLLKDMLARFSADVIGECAFGIECRALREQTNIVCQIIEKIFKWTNKRMLLMFFANSFQTLSQRLGILANEPEVIEYFMKSTEETVKYREQNKVQRKDFLNILIELKNENKDFNLTLSEMAAQSFLFFAAGFETASNTISWFLYEISMNREIQNKLRVEIHDVINRYDGEITYESLQDMIYLEMCINETLRKYPPAATLFRIATEDYKIPDSHHLIKKGTQIFIPIHAIHNDERYFNNPDTFDPERFSTENIKSIPQCAFIPFGEGPRNCIGMRFGWMQVKIAIISIIMNYRCLVNQKTASPMVYGEISPAITPKHGIWLDLEKIQMANKVTRN